MLSSRDLEEFFTNSGLPDPYFIRIPDLPHLPGLEEYVEHCNFLLYEVEERVGHWCIIWYSPVEESWLFFDPYGFMLDDQLEYTYHKDMDLTEKFLEMREENIDVNEYRYQADGTDTCGKICAIRYLWDCMGYSIQDFKEIFYDDKDLDSRDILISTLYDVLNDSGKRNTNQEVEEEEEEEFDVNELD